MLSIETAQKLKFLQNIHQVFCLPDKAYCYGIEIESLTSCHPHYTNYWYGQKEEVLSFAQDIAQYFVNCYDELKENRIEEAQLLIDLYGLVLYWEKDDKALLGTINLEDSMLFCDEQDGIPEELKDIVKSYATIEHIIKDDTRDYSSSFLTCALDTSIKSELANFMTFDFQRSFLQNIK